MTRAVWCPFAVQDVLRSGAGVFVNATAKIVHHTTEGSSYGGARAAYEKTGSLPHFTDSFEHGRYEVWQHLPIDQAATALKHPKGKPETNRANAVQIEHVGFAGRASDFPDGYLLGIATLCRWVESERGVPRSAPFAFGPGAPRLSWEQWESFGGHFGHCHVPGNDHWDPGALDIGHILSAGIPPLPAPAVFQPAPVVELLEEQMRGMFVEVTTSKANEANAGCGWTAWDTGQPVNHCQVSKQGPFPEAKEKGGDGDYWMDQADFDVSCQPRGNSVIVDVRKAPPGSTVGVWVLAG